MMVVFLHWLTQKNIESYLKRTVRFFQKAIEGSDLDSHLVGTYNATFRIEYLENPLSSFGFCKNQTELFKVHLEQNPSNPRIIAFQNNYSILDLLQSIISWLISFWTGTNDLTTTSFDNIFCSLYSTNVNISCRI